MSDPTKKELRKVQRLASAQDAKGSLVGVLAYHPPAQPLPAERNQQPVLNPVQEAKAQRALVKQYTDSWGKLDKTFVDVTPMGAMAQAQGLTQHSAPVTLQNAYNNALGYFTQVTGDAYLGSYLMAMGLSDAQQRQSTLAALQNIINGGVLTPTSGPMLARGPGARIDPKTGETINLRDTTPEMFGAIVADPTKFRDLNAVQQAAFIEHARTVVNAYQGRGQQAQWLQRTMAAIATGDAGQVLDDSEVADLNKTVQMLRGKELGQTEEQSRSLLSRVHINVDDQAFLGLQEQTPGTDQSVVTFDADWAKAHPAAAATEAYYIQQAFPNATIKFGDGGIASHIFNALGKPIDVVATPFSAAIGWGERAVRHALDNGSVPELQRQLRETQEQLNHAPLNEREDLMNRIDNLRDRIGVINGDALSAESFGDMWDRSLHSDTVNLGFARNIVEGTGLLPGDGGYEVAVGTTMLVGGVLFDPLTYITGGAEGLAKAATVPRLVGEAEGALGGARAVRGIVARFVYNRLAKTPEELIDGMGAADALAHMATVLPREQYAYVLGRYLDDSPTIRTALLEVGGDPEKIRTVLMTGSAGPIDSYRSFDDLVNARAAVGERLNEAEALQAQAYKARDAVAQETELGQLEHDIAAMHATGTAVGPEYDAMVARATELEKSIRPKGMDAVDRAIAETRPRPGESPVAEGFALGYHETDDATVPLIQQGGIRESSDGLTYFQGERGAARAASGQVPSGRSLVEFIYPLDAKGPSGVAGSAAETVKGSVPVENLTGNVYKGRSLQQLVDPEGADAMFRDLLEQGQVESYRPGVYGGVVDNERVYFALDETDRVAAIRTVDPSGHGMTFVKEGEEGKNLDRLLLDAHWDDLGVGDDPNAIAEAIRAQRTVPADESYMYHVVARDRLNGLSGVGTRLDELKSTMLEDKAEALRLNSLLRGKVEATDPMHFEDLKQLTKASNYWASHMGTLDELVEFPYQAAGARRVGQARRLMKALRVSFNPSGLEGAEAARSALARAIWLPGVNFGELGILPDALERSREALTAVGETLKVPQETIARWMGQWDDLVVQGDRAASYRWFNGYWDGMLQGSVEAGAMTPEAAANLKRLWANTFESWGSDVVHISKPGEVVVNEPLGYKLIKLEDGTVRKASQPVFSADALNHGVFLPDLTNVIAALHPRMAKYLTGSKLTKFTAMWKRVVLTGKTPLALPTRIIGELVLGRMSAYDLAALSPLGIVDYARSIFGKGKFAEFADADEAFALGNMLEDFESEGQAFVRLNQMGVLNLADGTNYWRAMSGRFSALVKSPEVRYALRTTSPEEFSALVHSADAPEALQRARLSWDTMEGGSDAMAQRVWRYINEDVVGTGDFAPEIRRMLGSGTLQDGTEAGTTALAARLQAEAKAGRYFPGLTDVHAKYGAGLYQTKATTATHGASEMLNKWMGFWYSRPEAFFGRIPAYRQLATRYFRGMKALGYDDEVAHSLAATRAQRDVADMFFKIGAHTSGEFMVQNLSPFFPAWRELTTTWLHKIPQRLGGGSHILGYAYMAQRSRLFENFLEHAGIVETGPDGRKRIALSIFNPLVNALMPGDTQYDVSAPLSSVFGVLPFPSFAVEGNLRWSEGFTSMLPGLGGAYGIALQTAALGTLDRSHPGWALNLADFIAPYGQGDIGGNFSKLWTAVALMTGHEANAVPPWEMLGSHEWRDSQVHSAIDTAMRELVASGDPRYQAPQWAALKIDPETGAPTPEAVKEFVHQYSAWQTRLVDDATHLAGAHFAQRAIAGALLPLSAGTTTEEEDAINAIWGTIYGEGQGIPQDVKDQLRNPLLESFKAAYPYADWYTIGKTEAASRRGKMSPQLQGEMEAMYAEGIKHIRSPQEYAAWSYGSSAFADYLAKRDAIYARFKNNPVDYLLNGGDAREEIANLDGQWQAFLNANEVWARDMGFTPFRELQARVFADTGPNRFDVAPMVAEQLNRSLTGLQGAIESGTYKDVRGDLFRLIDANKAASTGQGRSMWTAIDAYYSKVADPYYEKLNAMYDKVNALPQYSPHRGELYNQIREFTSSQKPRTVQGVRFPTPEVVAFSTKTPEEQTAQVMKWNTTLEPWWMTDFQRDMTGMGGTKPAKARKLADYMNDAENEFKARWPSSNMSGYDDARKAQDRMEQAHAEQLGAADLFHLWKAPAYAQMDAALGSKAPPAWSQAVDMANSTKASLDRAGYVLWSTSTSAAPTQRWLFSRLNNLYRGDADFASLIDNAAAGMAEDPENPLSRQDVFWKLFFNGYGFAPAWLT